MKHLIVRWRDGYCNLAITHIARTGSVVEAFRNETFIGMFDLGAVDVLYITERIE